ncbi:MAG TPA: YciI family protein [Kofleriaceae bacterium]|nr:YciI family protein [Kofleriaceae bacterium]
MRLMMTLQGDAQIDASIDEIDAYLAAQGATVLGFERLDPTEVATISASGDEPAIIERAGSLLRAVWILDVASRAAAVELARGAPGDEGTLEIRESFTPQDFGAPADAPPPPPPPPVKPGHARYIALIRQDAVAESSAHPKPESMAMMDEYMAPLAAAGTILGGEGLKPSAKGTRVRRMAKQRFILDGPFTETKELVGGYLIVQARSLDEAVDLIRPWLRIHRVGQGVPSSAIEVRRLV